MAETAHMLDTAASTAWHGSSPLTVVSDAPSAVQPTTEDEPRVGRTAMIGAAVGFAVVTTIVALAGAIGGGLGAGSAFGLGVFVGIWGGAGFGFMMGATIPLARHLDATHAARSTHDGPADADDIAAR